MSLPNCDVPEVALQWILQYSCTSNVELAIISNVNRSWRSVAYNLVKLMLTTAVTEELQDPIYRTAVERQPLPNVINRSEKVNNFQYLSSLMLPDMAFEIVRKSLQMYTATGKSTNDRNHSKTLGASTAFCLAWFHPKGIKMQTINLAEEEEDISSTSSSDDSSSEEDEWIYEEEEVRHFPGKNKKNGLYHSQKLSLHSKAPRSINPRLDKSKQQPQQNSQLKTCSYEWQGYRHATEVLKPFSYSTTFIRDILQIGADFGDTLKKESRVIPKPNNSICIASHHSTTFAVRGATLARPNGYCLCRDADVQMPETNLNESMKELDLDYTEHRRESYRIRKLKKQIRRQQKIRLARMKGYLPRIVMSTPAKHPTLQGPNGMAKGRRQRSMQFLNADGTRAVFVRTPPFNCGPVKGPVTIFCVGIATEDGCFLSGLDRRFELGHLHAANKLDTEIDMSPICLVIDEDGEGSLPPTQHWRHNQSHFYSHYDSDSSHEEDETYCRCQFQFKDPEKSEEEKECYPDAQERNILRGKVGPGRWHCYTAKIDGGQRVLRVDGVDEPTRPGDSSFLSSLPVLDGLTIGSDHLFDMTLCFGEGSDGEGEGSIAELAVFRGSMNQQDIEKMENHLMTKHGVLHGSAGYKKPSQESVRNGKKGRVAVDQWQEDKWRRDAHALMTHPPPYQVTDKGFPLRIAANHKSVAWYRTSEVTGKKIRVSRIGSKLSTGSSDW